MKNNKFSKIALLVLTLALAMGSIVPVAVSAEDTATATTKPEITQKNVSYEGDFALMFAVDASTVTAPVKLYCFDTEPTSETVGTLVSTSSSIVEADADKNNLDVDSYVLKTSGVAASKMVNYSYFQVEDATGAKSDVIRYSVAEYLYERLASGEASDTQTALYNKVIEFGDAAQAHFTPDATSIANYRYVTVEGGFVDGYTAGVYPIGTSLTPSADGAVVSKWSLITYDSTGNPSSTTFTGSFTVADAVKNEVKQGTVVAYRDGIETFESCETIPTWVSFANDATQELTTDSTHGKVVKYTYVTSTSNITLRVGNSGVSAADSSAFEVSFDMKVDHSGITDRHNSPYFEIKPYVTGNSSAVGRWFLYTGNGDAGSATENQIWTNTNSVVIDGSDSTQWNHFRMVIYKNDLAKAYVYVNGDTTNPMVFETTTTILTSDTYANLSRLLVQAMSRTQGAVVYIDNVYSGFVK